MSYIKDSLYNTSLPILVIEEKKRYREYPQIGYGSEGSIHRYNNKIAFKTFDFTKEKEKLEQKFKKIELLGKLKDDAFCFPLGLAGYEDLKKEGYYMDLVDKHEEYEDFDYLQFLNDFEQLTEIIIKADEAMQRAHEMGIILGDIRPENIMIDKNGNPKFVDTDNYAYKDFNFDIADARTKWLSNVYNKKFLAIDNDRYVFAMMALQYYVQGTLIYMQQSDYYFKKLIEYLNVSKDIKEDLRLIFSDACDKPYIGPILKRINPKQQLIDKEDVYKLNRII